MYDEIACISGGRKPLHLITLYYLWQCCGQFLRRSISLSSQQIPTPSLLLFPFPQGRLELISLLSARSRS